MSSSNPYFSWVDSLLRFVRFNTVKAEDCNDALDQVSTGFDQVDADVQRTIRLPADAAGKVISLTALQRAGLLVGFDASGNVAAVSATYRYRGDWQTATLYKVNDLFRDAGSKNLYYVAIEHTSGGALATDIGAGKDVLAFDFSDVQAAVTAAAGSASAAAGSASAAAGSASDAAGAAATATTEAGLAMGYRNSAGSYATAASTSAGNAATSETNAATTYTNFDKRYLGAKSADPTLNNQGGALADGSLYFNTVAGEMRIYRLAATSWLAAYLPATGYVQKAGDTLTGALNEALGTAIAVASSINLTNATGNLVHLTGAGTVNTIVLAAGAERTCVVDAAGVVLVNGASLLIPGSANVTTQAGDRFKVRGDAGGVANIVGYMRADGTALTSGLLSFGAMGTPAVVASTAAVLRRTARLGSTLAIDAYTDSLGNLRARAVINTGGVISYGAAVLVFASGSTNFGIKRLTGTTALVSFDDSVGGNWSCTVLSVSGSTISASTISSQAGFGIANTEGIDMAVVSATSAIAIICYGSGIFKSVVTITAGVPSMATYSVDLNKTGTYLRVAYHASAARAVMSYLVSAINHEVSVVGSGVGTAYGFGVNNGFVALCETAAGGVNFFYSYVSYNNSGASVPFAVIADMDVSPSGSKIKWGPFCPMPAICNTNRYPSLIQLSNGRYLAAGAFNFGSVLAIDQQGKYFKVAGVVSLGFENGIGTVNLIAFDGNTAIVNYADAANSNFVTDVTLALGAVGV